MAIADRLNKLRADISDAYTTINTKGGSIPNNKNTNNLADSINSIPNGGGSSDLDWTALGYSKRPQAIDDAYNYSLQIKNNWDSSVTNLSRKFQKNDNLFYMPFVDTSNATTASGMFGGCTVLTEVALIDTSNVTDMSNMFGTCTVLKKIPQFNTSKVTNMSTMFNYCTNLVEVPLLDTSSIKYSESLTNFFGSCKSLSDNSLDNILQMCINADKYMGTKTLQKLGINNSTIYPTSRIEALPHYQDFIDAGWSIGY